MRDRVVNWSLPFKSQIAVAWLDRQTRNFGWLYTRTVDIELLITKPISPTLGPLHELSPDNLFVEFIGSSPVGNVDDAVVKSGWHHADFPDLSYSQQRDCCRSSSLRSRHLVGSMFGHQ
jgi:hypothetical protein